jgi:hypothetical protein
MNCLHAQGVVVARIVLLIEEACRVMIDFGSVALEIFITHRNIVLRQNKLAHAAVPGLPKA